MVPSADQRYSSDGRATIIMAKAATTMTKTKTSATEGNGDSPSRLIDARIKKLGDWRGEVLARVRALIKDADPDVVEEVKWRKPSNNMLGVPVCLFNASLEGNMRRAIDIHEGEKINEKAFKALIREAVALNVSGKPK